MAATYGLIKASCFVSRLLAFAWRHACRKPLNLYERYGSKTKKSWAVVTGGSDGYGLDLCHKLADQGFNICIVARNEQKMKDKLAEIKADVDKKYIVANLMTMTRIEEYQKVIADKLQGDDVALLFLNAGVGQVGPFSEIPAQRLEAVLNINAVHPMYTTKVMVKQLMARQERSAIVVTSSGLGARPVAGCVTYSAAKACSSYMAQALSFELSGKVDVMSWEAGPAGTKMMPAERRAKMHPVGSAVDGMLKDLGRTNLSYGPIRHDYQLSMFMAVPNRFIQPMMFKAMSRSYHADIDRVKKEGASMEEWLVR